MIRSGGRALERRPDMSITQKDVFLLSDQVLKERGSGALKFVDREVNRLRREGDQENAVLWSMVLAQLYREKQTSGAKPASS